MSTYRFLSTCETPDVFLATVVDAPSRAKAHEIMKNRLNTNETVVSVNVLENGQWLVLEGKGVSADQIQKHANTHTEVKFEGPARLYSENEITPVLEPEKASGKTVSAAIVSDEDQPIVKFMWFLTALVGILSVITAAALSSNVYNSGTQLSIWASSLLLPIGAMLATFAMKYLSGIYITLRRIESKGLMMRDISR
ncbi:hypothetical protein FMN52_01045 [Marinobacter sp. BW6]|uniref:hypothetical protein n=1 Tax=Marinobacter sp. BW6 TaxID=2592624 RepID=UPI0011DEC8B4|nr:hypothetical protein [Marinobacter sp. BW6]TYC63842.1 hypothetical protein FMN52_01045 [Marinobacter sp. BW6]